MCAGKTARFARYLLKVAQLILAIFAVICLYIFGPHILWITMLCSLVAPIFGLCCMWQCPDTKGKAISAQSRAWLKADYILCFLFFFLYLVFAFIVLYHFVRFHHKSSRGDLLAVLVFISWAASLVYLLNALLSLHQFKVNNRTFHLALAMAQSERGTMRSTLGHQYSVGGVPKSIMRANQELHKQRSKGNRLDVYADNQPMHVDLGNPSALSATGHLYDFPPKECQEVAIELGDENGGKTRHSAPAGLAEKLSRNRDSSGSDLIIDHLAVPAHRLGKGSDCSSTSEESSRYASLDVEGIEAMLRLQPHLDAREVLREARVNLRKIPYAPPEMNDKSLDQSRECDGRRVTTGQSVKESSTSRFNNHFTRSTVRNSSSTPQGFTGDLRSNPFISQSNQSGREDDDFPDVSTKSYYRFDNSDSYVITEDQLDGFANRQSLATTDDSEISEAINQIIRAVEEPKGNSAS